MAFLTIDSLLNEGLEIFVRNTRPKNRITLTVHDAAGKAHIVQIPPTRIPIHLSGMIAPDMIRNSMDIRAFLSKNVLVLMDPQEAREELTTPRAQKEIERISKDQANLAAFMSSNKAFSNELSKMSTTVHGATTKMGPGKRATGAGPRVLALMLQLEEGEIDSDDVVDDLNDMADTLTNPDLIHVIRTCQHQDVVACAKSMLADRIGGDDVDSYIVDLDRSAHAEMVEEIAGTRKSGIEELDEEEAEVEAAAPPKRKRTTRTHTKKKRTRKARPVEDDDE